MRNDGLYVWAFHWKTCIKMNFYDLNEIGMIVKKWVRWNLKIGMFETYIEVIEMRIGLNRIFIFEYEKSGKLWIFSMWKMNFWIFEKNEVGK